MESDMEVIAEAQNAQEVIEQVEEHDLDIIVMDISMPGRSGLDVLKDLKREYPKLPVLILSIYPEERFAVRALKSGASGYITKESAGEELVEAIRKVVQGKKYISPSLTEKLVDYLDIDIEKPLHEKLSNREYEIMCMIAEGKTVKEIAVELSLSINTINTYRRRILEKMKMKIDSELIRYCVENKLIG
jgi:DNA-binding NarL/FixJ family response regulator